MTGGLTSYPRADEDSGDRAGDLGVFLGALARLRTGMDAAIAGERALTELAGLSRCAEISDRTMLTYALELRDALVTKAWDTKFHWQAMEIGAAHWKRVTAFSDTSLAVRLAGIEQAFARPMGSPERNRAVERVGLAWTLYEMSALIGRDALELVGGDPGELGGTPYRYVQDERGRPVLFEGAGRNSLNVVVGFEVPESGRLLFVVGEAKGVSEGRIPVMGWVRTPQEVLRDYGVTRLSQDDPRYVRRAAMLMSRTATRSPQHRRAD